MPQTQVITHQQEWENIAARLGREPELAVDTESNSLHVYKDRICLVQIGTPGETFLIDPLAVRDLTSLGKLLADPAVTKDLHGADYDLRCFDRDYQFRICGLFDTHIAARFLGETTPNLGTVLETFLDVSIPKSRQLQRSNWAVRPLTQPAIDYAASDVHHLVKLSHRMRVKLKQLGRLGWVEEECRRLEKVRYVPAEQPETAFFRVKGADRLGPRDLAVLKELYLWREQRAEQLDRPPFRVVSNDALVLAAQSAVGGPTSRTFVNHLSGEVPELRWHLSNGARTHILSAIERGLEGPLVYRPQQPRRPNPWTSESRTRLQKLKERRTRLGQSLRLDPALVWPAPSLERLALKPESWRNEVMPDGPAEEVRAWQRREFGREFTDALGISG